MTGERAFVFGVALGLVLGTAGCSASFVGPATQGEPERVRCEGGGTCPVGTECRPGGICAYVGPTGAQRPDAGAKP